MHDKLPPVLHLIDSLAIGGAERMAVNMSNTLASQGHKVHLCASRDTGPLESFISQDVSFLMLGRQGVLDFCAIGRLINYIRAHCIKVVHAHSSSFFLATIIKPLTGIKIVWHDHFGGSEERLLLRTLRICSVGFSWVFSVNLHLMEWARENLTVPDSRISYLPNFPVLASNLYNQVDLPGVKEFRIICAARLNPQKDHHTLVHAMQTVTAVCPETTLLLVGDLQDDAYVRSVKSMIASLGLLDCIHLLGARTDIADILSECAIGVLSSKSEGLPVALLEYGLSGLPVVCTNVGECLAVLGNGTFGRVVPSGQPHALAIELIDLLTTPIKRRDLGNAFRAHVNDNHSGQAICRHVSDIYRKILDDQL